MRGLRVLSLSVGILALTLVGGCSDDSGDYIKVGGGGFIFNYRIAEATAGVIAEPQRNLPDGAKIEASFENPAGGEPIVIAKLVSQGGKRYSFDTPPLSGIKGGRDYAVTVRVIGSDGTELQKVDYQLRSDIDQSVLPDKPLTIGPGYARNPEMLTPDAQTSQ